MDTRPRGQLLPAESRLRPKPKARMREEDRRSAKSLDAYASVQCDAGDADNLAPALVLIGNVGGKAGDRFRLRLAAELHDLLPQLLCRQSLIYRGIDLLNDRRRRTGGRYDRLPGIRRHSGIAKFVHGR